MSEQGKIKMPNEKIALIIPTKDRLARLGGLLKSISFQEIKPAQVIVVDGGKESAKNVVEQFPNLSIDYVKSIPSLTAQRNSGIKMLNQEITLVSFFDDDILLEKDTLKNMVKFWQSAPQDVGGAGYNNISDVYKRPDFFQKIFLVNSSTPGKILRSGFASNMGALDRTMRVDWIYGCSTIWRKEVFNEFMFDEWFSGYARYEDVDFSYRVGKKYKLFIVHEAKLKHFLSLENVKFSSKLGEMEIVNRLYFVNSNKELSRGLCYWGSFGILINNMFKGLLQKDKRCALRAKGNITGFLSTLFQKDKRLSKLPFRKRLRVSIGDEIYKMKRVKPKKNSGLRVLLYHSITDEAIKNDWEENTVSRDLFQKQMEYLADNKYNVVSAYRASEYLLKKQEIPPRTVVITFDDGYKDNYINAWPVLKKYNFCATIFLTVNFLRNIPDNSEYLSYQEIGDMKNAKIIDFGCHGLSHKALTLLSDEELGNEINLAKKKTEEITGTNINLFAYPFGHSKSYNKKVINKLKSAGFKGAFISTPGGNNLKTDPFLIQRDSISWAGGLHEFKKHIAGAYDWCEFFRCFRAKKYSIA